MRIAVTGATGFVGKALLPLLLSAGHDVVALVRNPALSIIDDRVKIVSGGLDNDAALDELTKDVDVVLHVAGVVSAVKRQDYFAANVAGTIALAKAARSNGVKRFVLVSSLAAREPALNYYCESKAVAEAAVREHAGDMRITILRPAAVYGPGDTATLPLLKTILAPLAFIPGSATARVGLVHVRDLAQILMEAATQNRDGVFEIDDGSGGHCWPDLLSITQSKFGLPRKNFYIPRLLALSLGLVGDVVAWVRGKPSMINRGQLRQIYHADWRVTGSPWPLKQFISLQQGLPETIRWYQAQGLLPLHSSADTRPIS